MANETTKTTIAIYFDLENIDKDLNVGKLMDAISLGIEESSSPIFAIKLACGNKESIANFEEQLKDLNFTIQNAPHVSEKNLKNRADLILSLDAFESLYLNNPEIKLYVFITSDTDFTVIMDKLHKYGRDVWLVTRRSDKDKKLFSSCTDKILVIEDYFDNQSINSAEEKELKTDNDKLLSFIKSLGFDDNQSDAILKVLLSYEKDKWHLSNGFGVKLRNIIKDFSYKGKSITSQTKLFEKLKANKTIDTKKENMVDWFKING